MSKKVSLPRGNLDIFACSRSGITNTLNDCVFLQFCNNMICMYNISAKPTRVQQLLRWATVWPQEAWAEKWGAAVPLSVGGLDPHLTQCGQGRGLYLRTRWYLDPSSRLATRDMSRKLGLCPPFFFGGGLGSHLTQMWPGRRPTSVPSVMLIHPTVWLQYTNVTSRQDIHDRTTIR